MGGLGKLESTEERNSKLAKESLANVYRDRENIADVTVVDTIEEAIVDESNQTNS